MMQKKNKDRSPEIIEREKKLGAVEAEALRQKEIKAKKLQK